MILDLKEQLEKIIKLGGKNTWQKIHGVKQH